MQKTQNVIQNTLGVFFAVFLLYIVCIVITQFGGYEGKWYWLVLFFSVLVLVCVIACFLVKQEKIYVDVIVIALVALIPRIILAIDQGYVPFNDFQNYMNAGINAFDGKWIGGTVQDGAIDSVRDFLVSPLYGKAFYGIPFFYAGIAALFAPTVLGFQIGFSVVTTIGTILIYLIGAQFERKIGILAALLYAVYLAAVISAQVPTNQHFALVFTLAAIYVILLAIKNIGRNNRRAIFQSAGAGLLILCAQSVLPSSPVVILAITIFFVLKLIFNTKGIKNKTVAGCMLAIIIAVIYIGQMVCMTAASGAGLISNYKLGETTSYKSKIAVGLNPKTYGTSSDEYAEFRKIEDPKERQVYIDQLIRERLSDGPQLLNTLKNKARIMWAEPDAMNWWFTYQKIAD